MKIQPPLTLLDCKEVGSDVKLGSCPCRCRPKRAGSACGHAAARRAGRRACARIVHLAIGADAGNAVGIGKAAVVAPPASGVRLERSHPVSPTLLGLPFLDIVDRQGRGCCRFANRFRGPGQREDALGMKELSKRLFRKRCTPSNELCVLADKTRPSISEQKGSRPTLVRLGIAICAAHYLYARADGSIPFVN